MDYAYSPIQDINNIQRIVEPFKIIKPLYGKRILKTNIKNIKILRIKKV
jgi:hypothetical protein